MEESKKVIQNYTINNNNYGTVNGSMTGDIDGDISVQSQTLSDKDKKKSILDIIKLIAEILAVLGGIILGILNFINGTPK